MSDTMTAARDRVVYLHYVMRNAAGEVVESSRDAPGEPLAVLLGQDNLMRGIEDALDGRAAGERFDVTLPPEQAYGVRRDDWVQRVPKKHFPNAGRLRPGMAVQLGTDHGPRTVTVVKVGGKVVDVDLNHPQAGETLTFEIEVIEVRAATAEELAHRHVHGAGGHHH